MPRATSSRKAPGLTQLLFQPNDDPLHHQRTQSETIISWRPLLTRTYSCILQVSSLSAESVLTLLLDRWVDKTLTTGICGWFSHRMAGFPIMGGWFVQTFCTVTWVPSDLQPKCNHMVSVYWTCGKKTCALVQDLPLKCYMVLSPGSVFIKWACIPTKAPPTIAVSHTEEVYWEQIVKLQRSCVPINWGYHCCLRRPWRKNNGPLLLEAEFVLQVTEHSGNLFWHLTLEPRDLP